MFPPPTATTTFPAAPAAETPERMLTSPLLPAVGAAAEESSMDPGVEPEEAPLTTETDPPALPLPALSTSIPPVVDEEVGPEPANTVTEPACAAPEVAPARIATSPP